jgi:hypothetical protein
MNLLGFAYKQVLFEKDEEKGFKDNYNFKQGNT